MTDEDTAAPLHEVAAAALANRALMAPLLVFLEERGVLSPHDVDMIADVALTGVETTPGIDPTIRDSARRMLEETARNLADARRRRLTPLPQFKP